MGMEQISTYGQKMPVIDLLFLVEVWSLRGLSNVRKPWIHTNQAPYFSKGSITEPFATILVFLVLYSRRSG